LDCSIIKQGKTLDDFQTKTLGRLLVNAFEMNLPGFLQYLRDANHATFIANCAAGDGHLL